MCQRCFFLSIALTVCLLISTNALYAQQTAVSDARKSKINDETVERRIPLYVIDELGTELTDYRVNIFNAQDENIYNEWHAGDSVHKRLTLSTQLLKAGSRVVVDKPRYAAEWLSGDLAGKDALRVILRPEGRIKGRLLQTDDEPASNRYIWAYDVLSEDKKSVALTDDDGNFVVGSLPRGEYRLEIFLDQQAALLEKPDRTVNVDYAQTVGPLELKIAQGWPVQGRVVDAETGLPVRASIWISSRPELRRIETDHDGKYVIASLNPGWHVLQCCAEDENYISASLEQPAPLGAPGVLQALVRNQPLKEMNFRLQRGCALHCRLMNANNEAIASRKVYLNSENPQISRIVRQRQAITSVEGDFKFKGLPEADDYYIIIQQGEDDSTTQSLQFSTPRFSLSREESPKEFTIHLK